MKKPKWGPGQDKQMILDPEEWPCWPLLPVKKPDELFKNNDFNSGCGIIVAGQRPFTVFHTNLFAPDFVNCDVNMYDTVDDLLQAGWVVD